MTKKLLIFLTIALTFLLYTLPSSAIEIPTTTAKIEGQHVIENNTSFNSIANIFVLTAQNNAPMPEGSSNGEKEIAVTANSNFDFGDINYTNTGTYEYKISRKITSSKNIIADDSVYNVKLGVYSDGTHSIIFEKEGETGKSDKILYKDTYRETYAITFDPNGGTFPNGSSDALVMNCYIGEEITIPEGPTKSNYTFDYWKGSKYYPGQKYTVEGPHNFTAEYKTASSDDKTNPTDDNAKKDDNSKSSKGTKTGDTTMIFIYLAVFASVLLIILIHSRNSKKS